MKIFIRYRIRMTLNLGKDRLNLVRKTTYLRDN